ncbi:MAG TPA: exopolysaccharide biosynthesis protein, partial [Elusimicrobiota bacterium]|nr:exopolysaccharide biosynthesis protein [Elusimicrobiota bacterium]
MAAAAHLRRLRETLTGPVTLGELSSSLGREGIGLLAFLCALPFLQPVPLAGLGTPVGLLLAAVGVQLARGREAAALPRFASERRLEAATVKRLLGTAEKILVFTERFSRPRWPAIARSPRLVGTAIVLLGCIMIVPVFVPLGNPLTAAPLALLGLALLEEDGLFCALGLAGTVLALAYHAAFARLIWSVLKRA